MRVCSVDGCEKAAKKRGLCDMHHWRWQKHGDPLAGRTPNGDAHKWLLAHLDYAGDECLLWPYAETKGYGSIWIDGKHELAHIIVCTITHGPKPIPTHEVLHSCAQGHLGCVTPKHLRWGSRKENSADMIRHGTVKSKPTGSQVLLIYSDSRPQAEISADYGISRSVVANIKQGKNWSWLTGATKPQ